MPQIIYWLIQILFIPLLAPLFVGLTKKFKAKLQNRRGASIFQPYRDLNKLFHKDELISPDASWIFRFAPYLIFAVTLALAVGLPLFSTQIGVKATGDFLVFVYLLALGTFFLALIGLDAGSAFGGFASSREMLVSALAEGGLVLSLLTMALLSRTANLAAMTASLSQLSLLEYLPIILAGISFIIALLAETSRYPFDNPATHLELTMIHEAMILEYSGKRLALLEWAAANKYLIFISLAANLFFPWTLAGSAASALFWLLLKITIFCLAIALLESTTAKFRLFRLPDLLFTSFILSVIALALII